MKHKITPMIARTLDFLLFFWVLQMMDKNSNKNRNNLLAAFSQKTFFSFHDFP